MLEWEREDMRLSRKRDVAAALQSGECMADLARKWRVSRPSVSQWAARHLTEDDRRTLAENGAKRSGMHRDFDLVTRLELIKLATDAGWGLDKLGMAIGCGYTALWHLVHRHAPDGIEDALSDYRDDEPEQSAAA